jgi:signal transduction histidine kinase
MHGAGWLPSNLLVMNSLEIGGSLEIVLLSFALAYRIKGMKKELIEKELEKEQFKAKLLEDQKVVLEAKVNERTRELSEANATKDKFFSIIAHDLRSPMIALQGVGQKLEYFIKKDKQEKLLEMGSKIDQSIDQLNHLLNNLLNWAASQTGGIPHHPDTFDVNALIEENIVLYRSLADSKEVKVINNAEKINVHADVNAASTIIRNLLSNAIKFTPVGGQVTISIAQIEEQTEICIKDEGPGMSADFRDSLFERHDKTISGTRGEKGFGLGLKLCKEFVELNGGSIQVESTEGVGSMFIVSLPNTAAGIERTIKVA